MSLDYLIGAAAGAAPAVAVTAAITRSIIQRRAGIDPLTGVPGRAGLPALARRVKRGVRRGDRVAIAVLDLRGFKQINDTHGHAAGDLVLRSVADRLAAARPVMGVVRLGGDEFAAVITCPPRADWRGLLAALQVRLADPVAITEMVTVCPSATIGAAIAGAGDGLSELLEAADTAMYTARTTTHHVHVIDGGLPVQTGDRPGLRVRDTHPTPLNGAVFGGGGA